MDSDECPVANNNSQFLNGLKIVRWHRASSEAQLQEHLVLFGAVSVALDGGSPLQGYSHGIIQGNCHMNQFNHAVTAIGFDNTHSPEFWRLQNSWGQQWGESCGGS